ncbi:MFS transporter [Specibacter sp. AOP5-B1-6]|uniref:MFS transporter n=1 Tax=Specibacter sp. AOP5-B1-6 TaxID=3457653 RepID=UPI00402B164F
MSLQHSPLKNVGAPRWVLPNGMALGGMAIAFMSLYLGAGALTPMLVDYKERFHFAPEMLNVAFAVYAAGFLVAALVFGSLSDYLGRRPVLIGGLIVQLASNLLFLYAADVSWVIAGRIIQGIASGAATAAFTAAMVELAPEKYKRLGAVLGSVSLTGGLALGSLLTGLALEVTPAARSIVFIILILLTVLGGLVAIFSRETGNLCPGALRSMLPRVSVPSNARAEFLSAAPAVAAVWMLAGLSGGLAPNMVRSVFGIESPFWGGFAGFVAPAVSTIVGLAFAKYAARQAMMIGIYAGIIGAAAIIGGVFAGSLVLMLVGQGIAGIGFGACFSAALQILIPVVLPHQRAGIIAAVYIVAYGAFGLPVVIEGQLVALIGEIPSVVCYTLLTVVLTLISLIAQMRLRQRA